ncbi:NAD(P)/FAD-dependent oxidoreductase [Sphingomonas crocodyli]|uniref:NAD(P)/FAD-dependent oxidoreductase n=1 Tax=Sphingomonas crocodyli TaxID=1979270 RepID=A0A437M7C4_9SPHN|nr:NAD(P)/FAD-dependent oxidoreductase [Sphingomonas crocodyli]RVT93572.1 NAD(P)/FAD-dependent oxidoreductase [Sphingomonas crocodyli]
MADVRSVVVGAGVVGLAIAARLARNGLEPIILDAEADFGTGTSSRNSEVIHAGIYYPAGSLKASLCVRGRALLYDHCARNAVPHRRIGKLIFARDAAQAASLDTIEQAAASAGVDDLIRLDRRGASSYEAELPCHEALFSPSTGIIDAHAYMQSLLGEAEAFGGRFVGRSAVTRLSRRADGWGVHIAGEEDGDRPALTADILINAAGLGAHLLAAQTEGLEPPDRPTIHYARGHYFSYGGKVPFRHLIYPVPVPGGLGTHLTFDLAGGARFGPDVEWIDAIAYGVDTVRGADFLAAARAIWPGIEADRLAPAYSGIRPKLSGPGEPAADFRIDGPDRHGLDGLVNLFGIESPGLTSSLAIAEIVADKLDLAKR